MTRCHDVEAQRAAYDRAIDEGIAAVRLGEQERYSRAGDAFKRLNRRLLDRAPAADEVPATIERALTIPRPRARYYCAADQRFAAVLAHVAPPLVTDRVIRWIVRI